ncbi:hypothetical protein [Bacteroides sp.]|uniref:hypothetical protein n=1 Tax=Bacteroides sp. TaxID=29523 RepID=UPI002624EF1A|nr:hypothetical protein [Bacteroides sp.]
MMSTEKQISKEVLLERLSRIDTTCDRILEELSLIRNILEENEDSVIKRLKDAADDLYSQSIECRELIQRNTHGIMRIERIKGTL